MGILNLPLSAILLDTLHTEAELNELLCVAEGGCLEEATLPFNMVGVESSSQCGNNGLLEDERMIDAHIRATANEEHGSIPNNKFPGDKLAIDDGGGKLSPEDKEEETNHNNIIPGNKGNIDDGGGSCHQKMQNK